MSGEFFSAHFTTTDLPEPERLAAFHESMAGAMGPVDMEAIDDAPFHGTLRLSAVPGLGVVSIATTPKRVARQPASNETEESVILLRVRPASGTFRVTQRNREIYLGCGEAVVLRGRLENRGVGVLR